MPSAKPPLNRIDFYDPSEYSENSLKNRKIASNQFPGGLNPAVSLNNGENINDIY